MTADISSSYVRCSIGPKVVERSSLFEYHVHMLASGITVDMAEWSLDLGIIAAKWGLTPGQESRDKVAAQIREAADTLRAIRESVSA